jgi:uncharacterized protein
MNTRKDIDGFVAQKVLAVAGVSRDPQSFSGRAYVDLKAKGYTLYPVNPNAETISGDKCYPSLKALPAGVGGVLLFTKPGVTDKVVREAADAGIRRVWIQQGAQDEASIAACKEKNLEAVTGQCIMMFAEPVASYHGFHRWLKNVFGGIPKV